MGWMRLPHRQIILGLSTVAKNHRVIHSLICRNLKTKLPQDLSIRNWVTRICISLYIHKCILCTFYACLWCIDFQDNNGAELSYVKHEMSLFLDDPMRVNSNLYFTEKEVKKKNSTLWQTRFLLGRAVEGKRHSYVCVLMCTCLCRWTCMYLRESFRRIDNFSVFLKL